jgi:hypothetical protein
MSSRVAGVAASGIWPCGTAALPKHYICMAERHSELSSVGILAISMVIATVGGAAYLLVTPISPAKMVALEHAAISEPVTR